MRSKVVTSFLAAVSVAAAAGVSWAQNIPSRPGAGVERTASTQRAIGEVISVDAKGGKLAVKTAKQELSLNVQGDATKKSLESIKVGDKVNISYRDQGGLLIAEAVNKAGASRDGAGASRKSNN